MRVNRTLLLILAFLSVAPLSARAKGDSAIRFKKPKINKILQQEFCTRLFEKEWTEAALDFTGPLKVNGFDIGIGSKMRVTVDEHKKAEGTFLGRFTGVNGKTTHYVFEDYADKKTYMIDAKKLKLENRIAERKIQSFYQTIEQYQDSCVVASIKNYFLDLLASGHEGNGLLRKEIESGRLDKISDLSMYSYYVPGRIEANYKPLLKIIGEKYGFICKTIELGASEAQFANTVFKILDQGVPVILEFYIGPDMITGENQWVNTSSRVGEDRRFWAPLAPGQTKTDAGHAVVASAAFESESGHRKLLIKDGDWDAHGVIWDEKEYFTNRIESSGMIGHYCEDLPK